MNSIRPRELAARLNAGETPVLLDVRQPGELEICKLDGVVAIPLADLPSRHGELDETKEIICICHHGVRSARAAGFLLQLGFDEIVNMTGGMHAWAEEVDPTMERY